MPARAEVEEELLRDAVRSDRLIAELAGVEHHAVGRARARLEAAGAIQPVPVRTRTPRWPNGPRQLGRAQRAHLCETCPILAPCAEFSLSLPVTDNAVWAGQTQTERLRRKRDERRLAAGDKPPPRNLG